MAFCVNCGAKLVKGSKFCVSCGKAIHIEENIQQEMFEQKTTERKVEYVGSIKKCPVCGEEITSFTAICPACGHELNSTKISNSLRKFMAQVDECEHLVAGDANASSGWSSWSNTKKIWWVIFNIFFSCIPLVVYLVYPLISIRSTPKLSKEEKRLVSLIENFPFPNDRESILEALVYAKEKIDFISKEKIDKKSAYWMRLWCAKAEQLKQKADLLFPNDIIVKQSYEEILNDENRVNLKIKYKAVAGGILFVGAMIFILTRNGTIDTTDYNVEYEWQETGLFVLLPEPEIKTGKIIRETEKQIQFDLYNVEQEDFETYVKTCRNKGFSQSVTKNDSAFYSENADGYDLSLYYYENKKLLSVSLDSYDLKDSNELESEETKEIVSQVKKTSNEEVVLEGEELVPDEKEQETEVQDYSKNVIQKGAVYTCGYDEWGLFVATAITDSIIKIEKWGKDLSSQKKFSLEYEVGNYKITDEDNEFVWLDDAETAFSFLLKDKNDWDFIKKQTVVFSILGTDSNINKGSNYKEGKVCYLYQNDDWHLYKAVLLTDSLIKIECWYRSMAVGIFNYGYDVGVIDIASNEMDFEWTDDEQTAFTLTMKDKKNSNLKKDTFIVFSLEE